MGAAFCLPLSTRCPELFFCLIRHVSGEPVWRRQRQNLGRGRRGLCAINSRQAGGGNDRSGQTSGESDRAQAIKNLGGTLGGQGHVCRPGEPLSAPHPTCSVQSRTPWIQTHLPFDGRVTSVWAGKTVLGFVRQVQLPLSRPMFVLAR